MFDALYMLAVAGFFCLILGVAYPVAMLIGYPLYRLCGGSDNLREYFRYL